MGRGQAGETVNDGFPWEQMKSQEQKQQGEEEEKIGRKSHSILDML